ncbi:DUF3857 domain-containing protein [Dysgonomonas sp. Marseille-P4677]|uniref:DUF3857 domain-containing protein n=1 Tax=Dysgonomonas sp. Marseille-P4677 TaxID=2364790 RepID=UPI001912FC2A|nr:DUF3857 domain-containing protein [Dysgonomonas sp. Marseille-P4677]MBK5722808.1 DUF3857 domain-containing protein [Dysgonomonas sp. Marseille-P4677]
MKKTAVLILMLFCLYFLQNSHSQSKYGNATIEELNMTTYPKDTTANAVMLLKKGETRFVYNELYGFQFEYTLQVKIKILKTEGLDWCNQVISYYQTNNTSKEEIRGLSGTTYNIEDGKIVKTKLSKEFIFDEDVDNKLKVKKFTMPAAKIGSVIEFKYMIVSDFFYELRDFTFQSSIPIIYTSYDIKIPEYFRYNTNFQGYEPIKTKKEPINESFNIRYKDDNGRSQSTTLRCVGDRYFSEGIDVPAIKAESYLWTVNDYISKVSFELMSIQMPYSKINNYSTTWQNIDKELLDSRSFGGNLKKEDLFKNEISKTEINIDRAKEIQDMVKGKVKWNDKTAFYPDNLKDALKNGIGNSSDVNFLLINALQAGGFDAFPVMLSTRSNGRIPITHPSVAALNYVITGIRIDTAMYFTDAAAKYGDWNLLPEKCMVPQARILKQNTTDWIDLTKISTGSVFISANYKIADSKLEGKVVDTRKGNAAYNAKVNYFNHKDQADYIESLSKNLSSQIEDFKVTNLENTSEALKMEYTQTADLSLGDDFIYITPMVDKLYSENPFKEEKRIFPVEFNHLLNYVQLVDFEIPEGYEVDELPKTERFVLNDNDITLTFRVIHTNNSIKLHYQYQLRKIMFLPTEYESLKDFFSKIILKNSEQIVLKKIASAE